jgi:hypothetical protein
MFLCVSAQDLFVSHGQRFQPIDGQFRLALELFDGSEDALGPFRVTGSLILRAAAVRDDFHRGRN